MKSTQAMRDRIRELMGREQDDYDRAVECVLDDLESLIPDVAQPTLPWPSREVVAREIRRAMLDNPTDDSFNQRAEKREEIANVYADIILARFAAAQPPASPVETKSVLAAEVRQEEPTTRNTAVLLAQGVEGPHSSAATEGVVGLEVLRHMADRQRGIGMPPKPMMRPSGSNADEWNVFLEEYTGHGNSFIAVQIAEAIEDAEKRGTLNEPQSLNVWQPIETAPKSGHEILVTRGVGHPSRVAFWDDARGGLWSMWPGREPIDPLAWMPLPAYSVTRPDRA